MILITILFILSLLRKTIKKMSIGIENNNPGNIRPNPSITWQGQTGVNDGYLTFDTMEHGIRAIAKNAKNTVAAGYNTPLKFFNHYAPASDQNSPGSYAAFVAGKMGIGVNDNINFSNLQNLINFVTAIIQMENGPAANLLSSSVISQGATLS